MTARLPVPLAALRPLAALLTSSALLFGGLAAPAQASAIAAGGGVQASQTQSVAARAARSVYLSENARLKLVKEGGTTLDERGRATGTFNANLSAHLNLYAGHVTAIFTISPTGGTITGRASARFVVKNSIVYYGGTLTIVHGTGSYRHAAGTGIGISGTINHLSFALTVKARGWMTL